MQRRPLFWPTGKKLSQTVVSLQHELIVNKNFILVVATRCRCWGGDKRDPVSLPQS